MNNPKFDKNISLYQTTPYKVPGLCPKYTWISLLTSIMIVFTITFGMWAYLSINEEIDLSIRSFIGRFIGYFLFPIILYTDFWLDKKCKDSILQKKHEDILLKKEYNLEFY